MKPIQKTAVRCASSLLLTLLTLFSTASAAAEDLRIAWTNNMLTITRADIPGGKVDIWYLEAFCRPGSTPRDWSQTTIPHRTEMLDADPAGKRIRLRTLVELNIEVLHEIQAGADDVDFRLTLKNKAGDASDVDWFQPCMRVGRFTGLDQAGYIRKSFIFTKRGLTFLDAIPRTEEARYRGGQVYVPQGINLNDVNPRPISSEKPVNGLIGCVSSDNKQILAMAWDRTQELFQGVIICLHNDPRVGGLKAGETKRLHGKVYILPNDPQLLLDRYRRDFP